MENDLLKAYAEVDKILSYMEKEYVEKVPQKLREVFAKEKAKDYEPNINKEIPLDKQNLQNKTLAILAFLNINYWCDSEEEKAELEKLYSENEEEQSKDVYEKYDFNKFLKKEEEELPHGQGGKVLIKYVEKESFIRKLLNKIKSLFRR